LPRRLSAVVPKNRLGKGLSALFPEDEDLPAGLDGAPGDTAGGMKADSQVVMIPLEKLRANPGQPRKRFDEESLKELADSIREQGIIQPLIAEDAGDGTWCIVAGERRGRAARLAGLTEVPVLVRN
jgi:ParB family chromosome partitioning protein